MIFSNACTLSKSPALALRSVYLHGMNLSAPILKRHIKPERARFDSAFSGSRMAYPMCRSRLESRESGAFSIGPILADMLRNFRCPPIGPALTPGRRRRRGGGIKRATRQHALLGLLRLPRRAPNFSNLLVIAVRVCVGIQRWIGLA